MAAKGKQMTAFASFQVGDLLMVKPASASPDQKCGTGCLVLVTDCLPSNKRFFYGTNCSTGETRLMSQDGYFLVSKA